MDILQNPNISTDDKITLISSLSRDKLISIIEQLYDSQLVDEEDYSRDYLEILVLSGLNKL